MRAFDFDAAVLGEYASFSRSFTKVRASDLEQAIDRHYDEGHYWPEPLLSLNPAYEQGPRVEDLALDGVLTTETASVFRANSQPLQLYRHQGEAVAKTKAGQSFVVTTGTGSGKSLCFFVPIVDRILRARASEEVPRTRAIIVYPMNALANSQLGEVAKFVEQSELAEDLRPTVARYTGQESETERKRIASNAPDILLTNYMMLELLLTRQDQTDAKVIENCRGLEFIVLDELHTYRGRQGADVSLLVRRLKNRTGTGAEPICIGTSATMASEEVANPREAVAKVASRIFGTTITPDAVITESLRRATNDERKIDWAREQLKGSLTTPVSESLSNDELRDHPLAVWAELTLGLDEAKSRARRNPTPLDEAVHALANDGDVSTEIAGKRLAEFLAVTALPETDRGGTSKEAFMAFKLHRFISGASDVLTTLKPRPRNVLLEGQQRDPEDPQARLYATRFCRSCGQEYHVVSLQDVAEGQQAMPRDIDDTPSSAEHDDEVPGYLTPYEPAGEDFRFDGEIETYPENWREERRGAFVLRQNRRRQQPRLVSVRPGGLLAGDGAPFWFLPGRFGFCLACGDQPSPQARERNKLGGLTAEGRSSATTTLVTSMLRTMNTPGIGLSDPYKRKTLGFGDNRQDSALQAGHFNDSVFVTLLRGAILRAVLDAGPEGLPDDGFGSRVQRALGYLPDRKELRPFWMAQPETRGANVNTAASTLAKVIEHRVWGDMRRGWRFTYPNLVGVGLVRTEFLALDDFLEDEEISAGAPGTWQALDQVAREEIVRKVLGAMMEGLYQSVWTTFAGTIRVFLENPYVFSPFWKHHNGEAEYTDWEDRFRRAKHAFNGALMRKDTAVILSMLFDRLYVLRNQVLHGGSTWNSSVNRDQIRDAATILGTIVPIMLDLMMDNPHEDWGRPFYPVVEV
ncbi:MAG: DEAD/DEAH box helicase [Maritimibacter sp.]|nr:DEAD/DEAH box helicase [Maritimibacter sp.]